MSLKIAIAQISPIWFQKQATIEKIINYLEMASKKDANLVVFGESILPGYPFWLSLTHGSKFNSQIQKEIHAHYIQNSIQIENGDLLKICDRAKELKIAVYIGITERPVDRGNHSLYCSLVYINQNGDIKSVHRKLQPTYEERLCWAIGDGHGLQVHQLQEFTVGGLNCWENWMPLSRTALVAQGENVHIAVWPGSDRLTKDITRFAALESRSYVISASGIMRKDNFPENTPHLDIILANAPEILANGGSCIASPDGEWLAPPLIDKEELIIADLDINKVFEERQNLDIAGHYSRPDITKLEVNRTRQKLIKFT